MPLLPADERSLGRALDLAESSASFASPNPAVGCVLSKDARTLGEGSHNFELRDHAEITALKAADQAGHSTEGATAFVTLEPCSHHGRTGPCADALVAAGIHRCVVATVDPNPLVRGAGLQKLVSAGISVDLADPGSALALRARRLNDAFAFSIQHGRPFVTLKAAASLDGKLAPPPSARFSHEPFWLTGQAAREDVQHFRHLSDAILTGIGTVLADDPSLTDRTGLPRRRPLLRVVLDSGLRTPLEAKLVQSAQSDLLLLCAAEAPPERESALRSRGVEILRLPSTTGGLDLDFVLATLAAIPIRSLLVEGGSVLNASLLSRQLADRVILYRAPVELGPQALPFALHGPTPAELETLLSGVEYAYFANGFAQDSRLSGYLHDPWAGV